MTRLMSMVVVFLLIGACATQDIPEAEPTAGKNNNANWFGAPGKLSPANSGAGRLGDNYIYAPNMRFPLESAPAYVNSQVYGIGGLYGAKGNGQCDIRNFQYPWKDNFCEKRSWKMPLCPAGKGHQGADIRASSCTKDRYWAVATEKGVITKIGSYTVYLRGKQTGTTYRYLHLSKPSLLVKVGQQVARGQRIGQVSNNMGRTKTTVHLHFDMQQTLRFANGRSAKVFVPPYSSLVDAYRRLLNGRD